MNASRPTIADVAREAQVSPSTASLVYSGKGRVADATRDRVLAAAAALGYAGPDPRAASLRLGRSGIVGVVVQQPLGDVFLDPVNRLMMDGLADALAPLGAGILLLRDSPAEAASVDTDTPEHPGPATLTLTTAPVDAVVLLGCSGRLDRPLEVLRSRGVPAVVIEGDAGDDVPRILLDDVDAQRYLAEHVRELGHERVAIVALWFGETGTTGFADAADVPSIAVTRRRLEGARAVYPDAPVWQTRASSIDEGIEAGRALLTDASGAALPAGERPTAVLAQSDLLAVGVIRAAEEAGLRVPDDLSVTGFDGIEVDGFSPRLLTTITQPAAGKGRLAGESVVRLLDGETLAETVTLGCVYRAGDTVAGPAGDRDTAAVLPSPPRP